LTSMTSQIVSLMISLIWPIGKYECFKCAIYMY